MPMVTSLGSVKPKGAAGLFPVPDKTCSKVVIDHYEL